MQLLFIPKVGSILFRLPNQVLQLLEQEQLSSERTVNTRSRTPRLQIVSRARRETFMIKAESDCTRPQSEYNVK